MNLSLISSSQGTVSQLKCCLLCCCNRQPLHKILRHLAQCKANEIGFEIPAKSEFLREISTKSCLMFFSVILKHELIVLLALGSFQLHHHPLTVIPNPDNLSLKLYFIHFFFLLLWFDFFFEFYFFLIKIFWIFFHCDKKKIVSHKMLSIHSRKATVTYVQFWLVDMHLST